MDEDTDDQTVTSIKTFQSHPRTRTHHMSGGHFFTKGALKKLLRKPRVANPETTPLTSPNMQLDPIEIQEQRALLRQFTNACASGRPSQICLHILGPGRDLSAKTIDGSTWTHVAIERKRSDVVGALIEAGADVGIANDRSVTPLMRAADFDNGEVVSLLINTRVDIEARDFKGRTALVYALTHRFESKAKYWSRDHHAMNPLLKWGANINSCDIYGNTPLHCYLFWLVATNDETCGPLMVLLDYPMDLTIRNKDGVSILDILTKFNSNPLERFDMSVAILKVASACITAGTTIKSRHWSAIDNLVSAARRADIAYVKFLLWRSLMRGQQLISPTWLREALFAGIAARSHIITRFLLSHIAMLDGKKSFKWITLNWITENWTQDGETILHALVRQELKEPVMVLKRGLNADVWGDLIVLHDRKSMTPIQLAKTKEFRMHLLE